MLRTIPLLLCLALCPRARAQTSQPAVPRNFSVEVQPGDGMYSLLRRYQLVEYGCNITEFKRLNKLGIRPKLRRGKSYQLPLRTYVYNGKSIRSTTGDDNYARALAIQQYNEALTENEVREQDFREDKLLLVPFHIDNCPLDFKSESAPTIIEGGEVSADAGAGDSLAIDLTQTTTSDYRTFDIFGPKHAHVPLLDRKLAGRIFYIVSGHGGPDPGAIGRRNGHFLHEDEYAYDVALRLTRNILQHGGTPYMIVRDDDDGIRDQRYLKGDKDETVWGGARIPRPQKARLMQRSNVINALYDENLAKGITDQTMISVHVDSRDNAHRIDLFFYYYEGDLIGAKQAERIKETIGAKYEQYRPGRGYDGTVSARDLHMLRETKPHGVYIELANITNPSDQNRIIVPRNRQLLADWILQGLMR